MNEEEYKAAVAMEVGARTFSHTSEAHWGEVESSYELVEPATMTA